MICFACEWNREVALQRVNSRVAATPLNCASYRVAGQSDGFLFSMQITMGKKSLWVFNSVMHSADSFLWILKSNVRCPTAATSPLVTLPAEEHVNY